ncbi:MAG TPA: hypothetical protein VJQ51_11705 [Burkholderiales bacterium]|nr:hypothetical protein [Burkholderiales bacterium]
MSKCDLCGSHCDKPILVVMAGKSHTFDCLECAIYSLAPLCAHCGCRVTGRGEERNGRVYCGLHCASSAARAEGATLRRLPGAQPRNR